MTSPRNTMFPPRVRARMVKTALPEGVLAPTHHPNASSHGFTSQVAAERLLADRRIPRCLSKYLRPQESR